MTRTAPGRSPSVAIVGSGPSGCYVAQFLRKRWDSAEIVIIDQLDHPYGLVNYGVALDHPGTKAVTRQFDRLFTKDRIRFAGDVEVGRDVDLAELREAFDVVVLATGLHGDRRLEIPGAELPSVMGSGRLTRLINGHPREIPDALHLGSQVTIIGHGNVAIDLVRVLLKSAGELRDLGVDDAVAAAITSGPVQHITVVGRSLPADAKFDAAMIRELAKSTDVRFRSDAPDLPTGSAQMAGRSKAEAVQMLVDSSPADAGRTVDFHFGWTPTQIHGENVHGENDVAGVSFEAADGSGRRLHVDSDSVCTAIGFVENADAVLRRSALESDPQGVVTGFLAPGLYGAGWFRRGPRGTIPENRADSRMVADTIIEAIESGALPTGKAGAARIPVLRDTANGAVRDDTGAVQVTDPTATRSPNRKDMTMDETVILFGTESGNAEMVAEDLAAEVVNNRKVTVADMTDFAVTDMVPDNFYIIICSTHGDGELPTGARPFLEQLQELRPDLTGVNYAMFGLGDSSYETYSKGSEHIDTELAALGARRVGVYGRHDASDGSLPNESAIEWMQHLYEHLHPAQSPVLTDRERIDPAPQPDPTLPADGQGRCPFPAADVDQNAAPTSQPTGAAGPSATDHDQKSLLHLAAGAAASAAAAATAAAALATALASGAVTDPSNPATATNGAVQPSATATGQQNGQPTPARRSPTDHLTVHYDPLSYAAYDHPYDVYRQLRDRAPVYYNPRHRLYVVSRHADVQAGLKNHEQLVNARGNDMDGTHDSYGTGNLVAQDPPRHTALRQAVRRTFAAQEILKKEGGLRQFARELLTAMRGNGGGNFAVEFALPLAIGAATQVLGAPWSDRPLFQEHLLRSMERTIGHFGLPADAEASNAEAEEHIAELVGHRVADIEAGAGTGDSDAITQIIVNARKGKVFEDEQVGLAHLVISAAIDAPAALLTNCVAVLDKYPALQGYLAQNPSMVKAFVEETLRYDTPGQNLCRQTTADITIAGVDIPNDSRVMFLQASANRDERVFPHPDDFDISREITPDTKIMSFGEGIHACMGAPLARLTAQIAMETLLDGTELRIVGMPERWVKQMVRGFSKLPITFLPGSALLEP